MNASRRDYDTAGSWSQKYNLIWDKVFGFGLFDAAIERECGMLMAAESVVRQGYGWCKHTRNPPVACDWSRSALAGCL